MPIPAFTTRIATFFSGALFMLIAASPPVFAEREHLTIVGSSTVYPFAAVVAERFGRSGFKNPTVESTGTGGGLKLFCKGLGARTPDIATASRRMKKSEYDFCAENGVEEILEILIGYDGIVFANTADAPRMHISSEEIYRALIKDVPGATAGEFKPNPHRKWSDINSALPDIAIHVYGPPPTSGTRDAFTELALERGCAATAWVAALKKSDENIYKARCHSIREDGVFIDAGENDNLIIQKLLANRDAFGIFGFGFLDQNSDKVQGAIIDGNAPEFELIAAGEYPVSRPLYIYVKRAHLGVIPGLAEFVTEFISPAAAGEDGYLIDRGLIPLTTSARAEYHSGIGALKNFAL